MTTSSKTKHRLAAFCLSLCLSCLSAHAQLALGPMVGHTTDTSTRIWVQTEGPQNLRLQLSAGADFTRPLPDITLKTSAEQNFTGIFDCSGLQANTPYHYRIVQDSKTLFAGTLRTAPAKGTSGHVRFAFSSCVGRNGEAALPSWQEMGRHMDFDLMLMLGDNHYGDTTDLEAHRHNYTDHRRADAVTEVFSCVPVYAIWDDHDFGPNNSDGSEPGKENSLRAFKEFWANPSYGEENNPGVYTRFSYGDVDFIMLDSRYHREPRPKKVKDKNKGKDKGADKEADNETDPEKAAAAPEPAPRSMLGQAQKAWLKTQLKASEAKVKIVACGSEFQSQTTGDCWGGFRLERSEILDFIRDNNIEGVILISGDRHFTAGYQVRGELIEITAGPLGSSNYPNKAKKELLFKHETGKMYCVFDIDTTGENPAATLQVYRAGEGLIDTHHYSWAQINGEEKLPLLQE